MMLVLFFKTMMNYKKNIINRTEGKRAARERERAIPCNNYIFAFVLCDLHDAYAHV